MLSPSPRFARVFRDSIVKKLRSLRFLCDVDFKNRKEGTTLLRDLDIHSVVVPFVCFPRFPNLCVHFHY